MAGHFNLIKYAIVYCAILLRFLSDEARNSKRASFDNEEFLFSSFQESLQMVEAALCHTRTERDTLRSPMQLFTFLRQAEPETQEISRAAEVFDTALYILKDRASRRHKRALVASELLSLEDLALIADLSGCPPPVLPAFCHNDCLANKYRSISGVCNNRQKPFWGTANSALARWLPAEYEDGEREPKGWNHGQLYNGFQLPPVHEVIMSPLHYQVHEVIMSPLHYQVHEVIMSPLHYQVHEVIMSPLHYQVHEVSKKILQSSSRPMLLDAAYCQMLVDWGQYIDHDISFTPQSTSRAAFLGGLDCLKTCENINPCFPIETFPDDKLSGNRSCVPFFRSSPACFSGNAQAVTTDIKQVLQRQQMNSITSFLDASTVYGHTPYLQSALRDLSNSKGRLAVNSRFTDRSGRPYLPFVPNTPSPCFQDPGDPQGERVDCFMAGDSRVNEVLTLAALHTLWMREHNRIAEALNSLNPHWSSEIIYQEARKIIGALHQIITTRDYVPKIIGREAFDLYIGPYGGYDATTEPSASNVFSTAAFRFGHATIPSALRRLNQSFQEHEHFSSLSLHKTFFSPWRLIKEGGLEPVLRGLLGTPATVVSPENLLTEELTERLVVLTVPGGLDLAALNLQRGRDHGLPGYNDWRTFCGLDRIETRDDFREVVKDASVVGKIMDLFRHPDNIDVWLGGLVEEPLPGSRTGPLFSCLIGKQIKMIRDGDRFWWESEGVFTLGQRVELLRHSLSRVICDNSEVKEAPLDPFRFGKYPDGFLLCDNIPSMNLEAWREEPSPDNYS
ncbi:thyroid peroxidase isoform X28 [Oncorhynchus keta]|uniref:thyroid peroxidase isoform X22 n=1 Tax=Oncorhynchus keta TaxID=8018 RepID=UPI00227CACD0|nr:thyroid peroxidase isoform X22 [Oncorhynchus keta]XP_052352330.1 thyroid peroxidase isoform X23 [Oncorhynchus keta]XP_052352331.1 thyroid peroxidase isoform X24 [Oncorhynchus keta]XP_052352332.1 thyroid peroxidase isoform X25 [Oncorhynchus keta]XP_052352333.1 thyroid peroxidase isoform X26 [Oncorhynchus keta]XP_052352334.1 thyroid peroxidase isoform X27 [Oncorhynchus keta]XP_052352335.1 thyroid peroxidase isoform X28 [Oncorhynchus keta]